MTSAGSTVPIDFRLVFESLPGASLVLTPDLTIVAATDAYLRTTMTERERIVGRGLFDVLPDDPDDPTATGVRNLTASIARALASLRPDFMPIQRYDFRRPEAEGGGFQERHLSLVNTPVVGSDGRVAYIVHGVEDVTRSVLLQRRATKQEVAPADPELRSEHRYRQLLDAAPDAMVVVDSEGRICFANDRIQELFGHSQAELLGESIEVLIPERFRPGHQAHLNRFFANPSVRPMGSALELSGRRRDGDEFPIEVSLSPLRGDREVTVSASIRDVSQRKRLEAGARLMTERLASAVESIEDAFALFDAADHLVLCNSIYRGLIGAALEGPVLGIAYETLLDAWMKNLVFGGETERAAFRAERLAGRGANMVSHDVQTRDGQHLRVTDRRTPEGGTVKIIWDLTDDVRREEALREARTAADTANAAKSEFLSSMSHELRTPLNAILGFAQLVQRDKREPIGVKHRERVDQILRGGEHLLRLINDILDLSRIEAGGISISTEPVAVLEVIRETITSLEPSAARASVRLELSPSPVDVPAIAADRVRFAQILLNFGSNAVKYNRPGGSVTFRVSAPAPGRVRVSVVDTGNGIPLEEQSALFQPFHRAGQEVGSIEGTGIGLTISKRLAEMMQGGVGFHSVPAQGSEFWVEMPAYAGARSVTPLPKEPGAPGLPEGSRGRVLYVEDNAANVRFLRDVLEAFEGIELITASNAEQGIELACDVLPQVIIMDVNLPGMSGLDALGILKDRTETRHIPVIALTAAASDRDRKRGEAAGFYRYLTKPVDVAELELALGSLLLLRA